MVGRSKSRILLGAVAAACVFAPWRGPAVRGNERPSPRVYTQWRVFTAADGLPAGRIQALRAFGGHVWVGTDAGLALYGGGQWKRWGAKDGLPWPAISAIDVDEKTRDVWLGTWGGGLIRFTGGRFDRFDQFKSGLAGDLVFDVTVVGNQVWAATNGGLSSYDYVRDSWDLYAERRADGPDTASLDLCAHGGRLFVAAWCGGLRQFDLAGGQWSLISGPRVDDAARGTSAFVHGESTTAVSNAGGVLWQLDQTRVFRRDLGGRWDSRRIPTTGAGRGFVHCLAAQGPSQVWLGGVDGLLELSDWASDTWVCYGRRAGEAVGRVRLCSEGVVFDARALDSDPPDGGIRCIAFDESGIWVGTSAGLYRGTGEANYDSLPRANSTDEQKTENTVVRTREVSPSRVAIGVVARSVRTIALPGGETNVRDRPGGVDRYAAQIAGAGATATSGGRGGPAVEILFNEANFARYGWSLPEDDVAGFSVRQKAAGLVGCLGPDSRMLGAVVLKTGLPFVNCASTWASTDERENPWVFRCRGHDPTQQEALLDYVFDSMKKAKLAVLRTNGPLAQLHLNWWAAHARSRGHEPVVDVTLEPDGGNLAAALDQISRAGVEVVLTWCDASTAAAALCGLRDRGSEAVFIGSDEMVCDDFARRVGRRVGAVLAPQPCGHRQDREARAEFIRQYARGSPHRKLGVEPELTFDAVQHLLEAVRNAGPAPEALRETLREMSRPRVARLRDGRWESLVLPDGADGGSAAREQKGRFVDRGGSAK